LRHNEMTIDMKTFFLGLGAQKAGTTWLAKYLHTSGKVATNVVKEYHVWDALHLAEHRHMRVTEKESGLNALNKLRFVLQKSPENYFNYFIYMMTQQAKPMTCDITPTYAGLNRTILQSISAGFLERGVSTKAIFLMRDPIERCWSAARQKHQTHSGQATITDDEVLAHARLPGAVMRTRYDMTIAEMEAAFEPSMMYVGIYEDMFEAENLRRISEFCGVAARPSLVNEKINATPVIENLSPSTEKQIATQYREVYAFVARRYPRATELWKGFKYL